MKLFLLITAVLIIPSCNQNFHITQENNDTNAFSPADLDCVDVWLDSEQTNRLFQNNDCTLPVFSNGDPVGCWLDRSGNERHATQDPTITLKPSYNTISGMIDFVNADIGAGALDMGFELPASYSVPATKTFAIAINPGNTGAQNGSELVGINGGAHFDFGRFNGVNRIRVRNAASVFGSGWIYNQPGIGIVQCTPSNTNVYYFSNEILNLPTNSCAWTGQLNIGHSGFTLRGYVGAVGEIIIFNKVLPEADRQKVEGYLACKWNLQSGLPLSHPYSSDCP